MKRSCGIRWRGGHALRQVVVLGVLLWCCAGARAGDATLTLLNPYPAAGAADIAGTAMMSKALRAMQTYANPSTTDALLRELQRVLAVSLQADVRIARQSRGGGEAAAHAVADVNDHLLFAGSGLTAGAALDAIGGLRPLALVAGVPLALVARNISYPVDPLDLLRSAGRPPLQIGTPGERSAGQALVTQLLQHRPGALTPVAFNGGHGALRGVLAQQVTLALVPLPAMLPYAANRDLRVLALAGAARHALLPGVPTFAEAGLAMATASGWHGLFASRQLPSTEYARWQSALAVALRSEDARQAWAALGYVAEFGDGERLHGVRIEHGLGVADRQAVKASSQFPDSSGGFTALNIFSKVRS